MQLRRDIVRSTEGIPTEFNPARMLVLQVATKCDKTVPCSSYKRRGCSIICPNGQTNLFTAIANLLVLIGSLTANTHCAPETGQDWRRRWIITCLLITET